MFLKVRMLIVYEFDNSLIFTNHVCFEKERRKLEITSLFSIIINLSFCFNCSKTMWYKL